MNRGFVKGAPWTQAEKDLLAKVYAEGGIAAARAALPHRSIGALYHRTKRSRLCTRRRRWTPKDDARLTRMWSAGEMSLRDIAAALGRTEVTTYWRATKLRLTSKIPDGWERLNDAATRTGYTTQQLRQILRASGVPIRPVLSRPAEKRGSYRGPRRSYGLVWPADVDIAVANRLERETVQKQARAACVAPETLARRLRAIGVEKPKTTKRRRWLVTDEQVQRALAAKLVRTRAPHGHYTGAKFVEATA